MSETKDASRFFQNRECPHFPCHRGIAAEEFNCLFCYCPLYTLGKRCGGELHLYRKRREELQRLRFPALQGELRTRHRTL